MATQVRVPWRNRHGTLLIRATRQISGIYFDVYARLR